MSAAQTLRRYLLNASTTLPVSQAVEDAVAPLASLHEQNAGATYSLYFGSQAGQRLYSVSVFPERSRVIGGKYIAPERLRFYLLENQDLLSDPRCCVGTWYNPEENVTYLDIVIVHTNKRVAVLLGRRYNQIGIFDLRRRAVIMTGGTGLPLMNLPPITERMPVLRRRPLPDND